jgi:hypothetical protein
MTVVALRKGKKITVGSLIDTMASLREQRRVLAKQDEELKAQYDATEAQLIEMMDGEECVKSTGKVASASISTTTVFNVADWDAFMAYLIKTKQTHLVQRRVSTPAVAEIFEKKGCVPGLEPFTKRSINLRVI